eukprot:symbB.v1.2.028724.t1/scaffold3069.1/size67865/3
MRRLSSSASGSPQGKWDILELMEESHHQLRDIRQVHSDPDRGIWQELQGAVGNEHTASTLPVSLRKQCEEILDRRKIWLGDFDTELNAILARGKEVRERLLFEDMDRASWFSAAGVSGLEVQRLLERHQEMHQRAGRLARQLKLLSRGLQQQGALSSRRRAFQAKTVGEKLQSSLVCLAAVAVAPVPGSSEMWLATTTMMWLDKDQAWQHVVYEHPRDADTDTILDQFQCRSSKVQPQAKATNGRTRKKRLILAPEPKDKRPRPENPSLGPSKDGCARRLECLGQLDTLVLALVEPPNISLQELWLGVQAAGDHFSAETAAKVLERLPQLLAAAALKALGLELAAHLEKGAGVEVASLPTEKASEDNLINEETLSNLWLRTSEHRAYKKVCYVLEKGMNFMNWIDNSHNSGSGDGIVFRDFDLLHPDPLVRTVKTS